MNNLIIDNYVIKKDIRQILTELKSLISTGKLKDIQYKSDNIRITCPVHKNGLEDKPSCEIYIGDSEGVVWGTIHCFACGFKGQLYDFVAEACDISVDLAKKWLIDNFTEQKLDTLEILIDEPINTKRKKIKENIIEEKTLDKYTSWHPYLATRKLSMDVCKKYDVKYDPETECIVFPVRDIKGRIKFLTRRSVNSKKFIIDKDIEKEVYLLHNCITDNVKEVYVVESQINALTLESWGLRAIALLGTGTSYQYECLNKSGILKYNLCFDGDEAGDKGITRFTDNISSKAFVDIIKIPRGKDVNDLSYEEFITLRRIEN